MGLGVRRRYRTVGRVAILGVFASAVACSLLLQEQSLPCASDADCAKFPGSKCDLGAQRCVTGSIADAASEVDAPVDAFTPGPDAPDAPVTGPDASDGAAPIPDGSPDVTVADAGLDGGDASSPSDAGPDTGPVDSGPPAFSWPALTAYLDSLYDGAHSLVQRTPGSGMYFTSPDNALAQRAFLYLPVPDSAKSAAINTRLASLRICGCSDSPGHNGLVNHQYDSLVHKGWTIPGTPGGPCEGKVTDTIQSGACTAGGADASGLPFCGVNIRHEDRPGGPDDAASPAWWADSCNATATGSLLGNYNLIGSGSGYADLIALEILSYKNRNLATNTLWDALFSKWDGTGVNDGANAPDGFYSTYKLALYRLAARRLGQPIPAALDAALNASQGSNGGIRSNYSANGFTGTCGTAPCDQAGDAKTTALVVLALRLPDSEL